MIGSGRLHDDLYLLQLPATDPKCSQVVSSLVYNLWHQRPGHPGCNYFRIVYMHPTRSNDREWNNTNIPNSLTIETMIIICNLISQPPHYVSKIVFLLINFLFSYFLLSYHSYHTVFMFDLVFVLAFKAKILD